MKSNVHRHHDRLVMLLGLVIATLVLTACIGGGGGNGGQNPPTLEPSTSSPVVVAIPPTETPQPVVIPEVPFSIAVQMIQSTPAPHIQSNQEGPLADFARALEKACQGKEDYEQCKDKFVADLQAIAQAKIDRCKGDEGCDLRFLDDLKRLAETLASCTTDRCVDNLTYFFIHTPNSFGGTGALFFLAANSRARCGTDTVCQDNYTSDLGILAGMLENCEDGDNQCKEDHQSQFMNDPVSYCKNPCTKTDYGETYGSTVRNLIDRTEIKPNAQYDPFSMWHSRNVGKGNWASFEVAFPNKVTFDHIFVYSQHSGEAHKANRIQVQVNQGGPWKFLIEVGSPSPFTRVNFRATESKKWRFWFQALETDYVVIRGIRFFNAEQELLPLQTAPMLEFESIDSDSFTGRVTVLPVFFVPQGEDEPADELQEKLMRYLEIARLRYKELLFDRDTFEYHPDPQVIMGECNLDTYWTDHGPADSSRIFREIFRAFAMGSDIPFVFLTILTSNESYPAGGGRPFNGGHNEGGGIVIMSSKGLSTDHRFESTLQHELGHSFGLVHIEVYHKLVEYWVEITEAKEDGNTFTIFLDKKVETEESGADGAMLLGQRFETTSEGFLPIRNAAHIRIFDSADISIDEIVDWGTGEIRFKTSGHLPKDYRFKIGFVPNSNAPEYMKDYDSENSVSIMSQNINGWTDFFKPSAAPAVFIAEDLKALELNKYVFPNFNFNPEQDINRKPGDIMGGVSHVVMSEIAAWEAAESCP